MVGETHHKRSLERLKVKMYKTLNLKTMFFTLEMQ